MSYFDGLNIGGGFQLKLIGIWVWLPMIDEIINQINCLWWSWGRCANFFTEFGSFTVGESEVLLYTKFYKNNKMIREMDLILHS
jgi:arginine decarboxylase